MCESVRVACSSGAAFTEGIGVHRLEGGEIRVYSAAKTVADCFEYRNKVGTDVAVEALRASSRHQSGGAAELARFRNPGPLRAQGRDAGSGVGWSTLPRDARSGPAARGDGSFDAIRRDLQAICAMPVDPDPVVFDVGAIRIEAIRAEDEYVGARAILPTVRWGRGLLAAPALTDVSAGAHHSGTDCCGIGGCG